jgi:hypothetical protein
MADPDGDHHAPRRHGLAAGGAQLVAVRGALQPDHLGVLDLRHEPPLERQAVVEEGLERLGDAVVPIAKAVLMAVRLERVGTGRVRQAGGTALGL